jgi:hypothetical protein
MIGLRLSFDVQYQKGDYRLADMDFIRELAQKQAAKVQDLAQQGRLQLHKAGILKASMPEFFNQMAELTQKEALRFDRETSAAGTKSSTQFVSHSPNTFVCTCTMPDLELYSEVNAAYDIEGKSIVLQSRDCKTKRFVATVNDQDTLQIRPADSPGWTTPPYTPQDMVEEIFRMLTDQ